MENPFNPTSEDINEAVKRFESQFDIIFEKDLLVTDISDIATECTQIVEPAIEAFGGRREAVRANKSVVSNITSPLLEKFLDKHSETLNLARVRIDGDMIAVTESNVDGTTMLKYCKSDELVSIEGYVRKIFLAAIPAKYELDQVIDNPSFVREHTRLQEPELHVCMELTQGKTMSRGGHVDVEDLGDVIVPLYPNHINIKRIDAFPSVS